MNVPEFKPYITGRIDKVSYTLFKNDVKYHFRGVPDFLIHKDGVGAARVLVAIGEAQSMNRPDVQNAIYSIGKRLSNKGPLLCVTLFKRKVATLSIARLTPSAAPDSTRGSVTLKYVVSLAPIDLTTTKGVMTFSTRLYNCLCGL